MSTALRQLPATILLTAALVAIWKSLTYPPGPPNVPGPGVIPLWLGVVLALLSLSLLIRESGIIGKSQDKELADPGPNIFLRLVLLISAMAAYALVMPLLGFISTTTLLSLFALRIFGYRGALHALSCSLGISFALFLLFQKLMNVPLPSGWLG